MYAQRKTACRSRPDSVIIALLFASAAGIGIMNLLVQHAVPAEALFQSFSSRAPIIALTLALAAAMLRSLGLDRGSAAGAITCAATYVWVHWGEPSVWNLPLEQIPERLAIFVGCVIATSTAVVVCYCQCLKTLRSRLEDRPLLVLPVPKLRHIVVALPVVALVVLTTQATSHEGDDAAFGRGPAADDRPVPVFDIGLQATGLEVERVQRGGIDRTFSVYGTVQASDDKKVEVRPTGDVVKLLVRQGDTVTAGTPMAVIRSAEISTLLSALVQERQAIEREIEQARTDIGGSVSTQSILVESTRVEFEREIGLKRKGITTDVVLLAVKTKYDAEKSKLAVLKKQLADALRRLDVRLKLTTKTAKSKALALGLSEKDFAHAIEAGDATADVLFLSPASGLVAGTPGDTLDVQKKAFVIIDPSQVWVVLDVPESDLANVRIGQHVSVNVADRVIAGAISSMGGTVDPLSRSLPARVVIDNAMLKLVPGMPVTGEIVIERSSSQSLAIPLSALIEEDGESTVYVRQGDNLFKAVAVTTGLRNAGMVEIKDGLSESDWVVIAGARQLHAQKHLLGRSAAKGHEHEHGRGHDHEQGHGRAHGNDHDQGLGRGHGHEHGDGHGHEHSSAPGGSGLSWRAIGVIVAGVLGAVALVVMRRRKG